MKIINLETCDRQILRDLGIQFTNHEVRRMSASNLKEDWTEVHVKIDESTLPAGAVILESGAFYGSGCVAVKDGHVVARTFCGACPWWDDDISSRLCIPEAGETLHEYGRGMNSSSFCYEDDPTSHSWWLRTAGAVKDASEVAAIEAEAERAARRARYEAARDRAELLYPYQGSKVFRAKVHWALEDGVADAAKALASHVRWITPHLRPLGGWPFHYRRISGAWHRAYGWNREAGLNALLSVCSKISQPRLGAAWQVAKILAS